jgi:hypothetical protein
MVEVIVIHQWKAEQKEKVMQFATTIINLAKSNKLPTGLKLNEINLAKNANIAVCKWSVDSLEHLLNVASSLKPEWQITAVEVEKAY